MKNKILFWNCLIFVVVVVSLVMFVESTHAGTGTTGAKFLELNTSVRSTGMGDASVALGDDAGSVSRNPAGLAFIPQSEIALMYNAYLASISQGFVEGAFPLGKVCVFGGINYLTTKSEEITDSSGDTTGESMKYTSSAANVGGASKLSEYFSLGMNAKVIQDGFTDGMATGYAIDVGTLFNYKNKLSIGISAENVGNEIREGESLPLVVHGGIAWKVLSGLIIGGQYNQNLAESRSDYAAGVEYVIGDIVALRGGYKMGFDLLNMTAGLGVRLEEGLQFDYAYLPYGDLGITHRAALTVKFGMPIEEKLKAEEDAYAKAQAEKQTKLEEQERIRAMLKSIRQKKSKIAVLDFESIGIRDPEIGKAVAENLRTSLIKTGLFDVVERTYLVKIVQEQELTYTGLVDEETAVSIGKMVGARVVVLGSITRIGTTYTFNVRFVDTESGIAMFGDRLTGESEDEIPIMIEKVVDILKGK